MNPPHLEERFVIRDHLASPRPFLYEDEIVEARLDVSLLRRLEKLPPVATLAVDFSDIPMASDAARAFLSKALRRVQGGELRGRGLVLEKIDRGLYNITSMLETEGLPAIVRGKNGKSKLVGDIDAALIETFDFLATKAWVVAREVQERFGLTNVAGATNRLVRLAAVAAARRVGTEPVEGGGMQYRWASIA